MSVPEHLTVLTRGSDALDPVLVISRSWLFLLRPGMPLLVLLLHISLSTLTSGSGPRRGRSLGWFNRPTGASAANSLCTKRAAVTLLP